MSESTSRPLENDDYQPESIKTCRGR